MWHKFRKRVFPLSNPKKMSNLSITQIDGFAASVCALAECCGLHVNIVRFNRLEGVFQYDVIPKYVSDWAKNQREGFGRGLLFLEYIYNIDRKNMFCREFVQYGTESKFWELWRILVSSNYDLVFGKVKKSDELLRAFVAKVKLDNEFQKCLTSV